MQSFTTLTSKMIPLAQNDVDTDQIIPARYLKVTDKSGLADALFFAWRYLPDGSPNPDFPLNKAEYQGGQILLAGDNFGCGSSREHAPWALMGWGVRAVISTSFADIFQNNSLKNGLLPIVVDAAMQQKLFEMAEEMRTVDLSIDLEAQRVLLPDGSSFTFPIDGFNKLCLLNGVDSLGYLLKHEDKISAYENA